MKRHTTAAKLLLWICLLIPKLTDANNDIHSTSTHQRYTNSGVSTGGIPNPNTIVKGNDRFTSSESKHPRRLLPPSPPNLLPLRFLRAGKNDPIVGLQRYEETLQWRKLNNIDSLLLHESFPYFQMIKHHYPHYYHYTGYNNEPCFYEIPAKTNFAALRQHGITIPILLRHYYMIIEFQWQYIQRNDLMRSIYIIDLDGMTMRNFFTQTIDFVKQAMKISSQHYPERAGYVYILNVPSYFQIIWNTIRPLIDPSTLDRVHILRKHEILTNLMKHIPIEHIPPQYGGTSVPLGYSPQERMLQQFINHRNHFMKQNRNTCANCHPDMDAKDWPCQLCRFLPARSY